MQSFGHTSVSSSLRNTDCHNCRGACLQFLTCAPYRLSKGFENNVDVLQKCQVQCTQVYFIWWIKRAIILNLVNLNYQIYWYTSVEKWIKNNIGYHWYETRQTHEKYSCGPKLHVGHISAKEIIKITSELGWTTNFPVFLFFPENSIFQRLKLLPEPLKVGDWIGTYKVNIVYINEAQLVQNL